MKEKIIQFLKHQEWSYVERDNILKLDVSGDNLSWSSYVKTDEEDSFTCFSLLPAKIPADRREAVMEAIHIVNTRIWFGNFEIVSEEDSDRQLRFRSYALIPSSVSDEAANDIIHATLSYSIATMNFYGPRFMKFIYSDSTDPMDIMR